jgi:mono/diheme cytochrome c family protein
MKRVWLLSILAATACGANMGTPPAQGLPVLHPYDAQMAAHGYELLTATTIMPGAIPRVGIENLWLVWPEGYTGDYWPAMRKRYGLHEAPFDNDGLPMGIRPVGTDRVTFDCLLCHGSTVAGQAVLGVANSTLDVQGLLDDMVKGAEMVGIKPPFMITDRTQAAGTIDAVGLGFVFGETYYGVPPGTLNTKIGWERAPAWWQLKHKNKAFNDGTAVSPGFRTMEGVLTAFGLTQDQILAHQPDFDDLGNWILQLEPPAWSGGPVDLDRVAAGRKVFESTCSDCHGHYGEGGSFPDRVVDKADVGTDPMRVDLFRQQEIDALNGTVLGMPALTKTNGYLAPTLVGIWARAPYLHNGSVPDLMGVLDSRSRPAVWRRTGISAADWDSERVGWRYDVPADPMDATTIEGRKIYDTHRPGLSNAGHTYGDGLSDSERRALLEYLKSL